MKRRFLFAILPIVLLDPISASTEANPPRLLLHVHVNFEVGSHGVRFTEEDLFLSTDRQVTSIVADNNPLGTRPDWWFVRNSSPIAGRDVYGQFVRRLRANHIGSQIGGCVLGSGVPMGGTLELIWYEGGQRVAIEASFGDKGTCPSELLNIVREINSFASAVGASGFGIPRFE